MADNGRVVMPLEYLSFAGQLQKQLVQKIFDGLVASQRRLRKQGVILQVEFLKDGASHPQHIQVHETCATFRRCRTILQLKM